MTETAPAPLREMLAAATRSQIVESAGRLFLENGYVGTSIGAIARRAGVAVQTIYNAVGNKAAVLSAVLDAAASGPSAPTPVPVFMAERAREAADVAGLVGVLADWFVEVNGRTAAIQWVIRQAASVDEDAAELERSRARQRLHNYGLAAAQLRERGGLSAGMTDEQAAATIWALGHANTYCSLVIDGSWSVEAYRDWLGGALAAALGCTETPATTAQ